MRVKLTCALCALAITIAFFSCSSDDSLGGGQTVKPPVQEVDAYISFELGLGSDLITRAETNEGSAEEQKVSSIYLLLFAGTDQTAPLHYCYKLDANTNGTAVFSGTDVLGAGNGYGGPGKTSFRSKARVIKPAAYQMVVIANLHAGTFKPTLPGNVDLKDMLNTISETYAGEVPETILSDNTLIERYRISNLITAPVSGVSPYNFFRVGIEDEFTMTNANGIISIPINRLQASEEDAEATPFYVHLDRVVSKVIVRRGANFQVTNGTLNETNGVGWGAVMTNTATYLVRKPDYLSDASQSGNNYRSVAKEVAADGLNPILSGHELPLRKYTYAADPNFDSHLSGTSDYEEYILEGRYWNLDPTCMGNGPTDEYQYILENTVSFANQSSDSWREYVTQVEVQAVITNPGGLTATDYYSFKNRDGEAKVFTHAQARMWKANNSFPSDMVGLAAAIAADEARPAGKRAFDFSASAPSGEFRTSSGITYHAGGLNIYKIPVKHFFIPGVTEAETARKTVYGHYGVVRNNVYVITINSITGPGDGSTDQYISSRVTINPWWAKVWDEDVKYE